MIMSSFLLFHRDIPLWKTPVEKSVENVENS